MFWKQITEKKLLQKWPDSREDQTKATYVDRLQSMPKMSFQKKTFELAEKSSKLTTSADLQQKMKLKIVKTAHCTALC